MQPTATAQLASPAVYSLQRKARRSQDVTHDPSCDSCTPHRRHASQWRSHMRPWHRWHARTICTHRRRARTGYNPNEHLCACRCATQAGACMQPGCEEQVCNRPLRGSGHATHKRAVASAARPAHNHHHTRTGFISAGYGPVRTAVGRRCTRVLKVQAACDEKIVLNLHRWM